MLAINPDTETEYFTGFPPQHKLRKFRDQFPGMSLNRVHACCSLVELRNMGAISSNQCQQLINLIVDDAESNRQFSPPDLQRIAGIEQGHKPVYNKLQRSMVQVYSAIARRSVEFEELF